MQHGFFGMVMPAKELVQVPDECLWATLAPDEAGKVMMGAEGPLPGGAFIEIGVVPGIREAGGRVKGLDPGSVRVAGSEETDVFAPQVPQLLRAFQVGRSRVFFPQPTGQGAD